MIKSLLHDIFNGLTLGCFKDSTVTSSINDVNFNYIIKYSSNVSNQSDYLPMLIALHGDGGRVDDFYEAALDKLNVPARIILLSAPISHEMGMVWPYSAEQFAEYGKVFSKIVDKLAIQYPTVNKPVLLGFSGGGTTAYYQAVKHGDSYSYIFPVSGLLFKEQLGGRSSEPSAKVYAYHGKTDEVVPFSAGLTAFNLLKTKGVNATFTEFEGGHQGLVTDMKTEITQAIEKKLSGLKN